MRLASRDETRRIDELTQERYGVSSEVLMEAAGALAAREIEQSFLPEIRSGGIAVVCGPGGNGGDGLVVARHLASAAVRNVVVFLVAPLEKRTALFKRQLKRVEAASIPTVDLLQTSAELNKFKLVVDAIFGVGGRDQVGAPYQAVIESIRRSQLPVVSLDTPTGLDVDRGIAGPVSIKAAQTITFGLAKPGFFISDGPGLVGRLKVLSIGFPLQLVRTEARSCFAFSERLAHRYLPRRSPTGNKSSNGHSLVIAGSPGMWGAALLSASSAYRMGSGYVTLASKSEPVDVLKTYPEILTADFDDDALWNRNRWTAAAIGPGLGTTPEASDSIVRLLSKLKEGAAPVVVDADAITVMAARKLWPLPANWVITPHAGELSRILGVDAKTIESDRLRYAREAARKLKCVVLLKGFRTVVANDDRAWVILSGNAALAKAGTGDVLTGMIVGLLAQGVPVLQAAATASYVHGRMADEWVRSGADGRAMQASDLRHFLPSLMARL